MKTVLLIISFVFTLINAKVSASDIQEQLTKFNINHKDEWINAALNTVTFFKNNALDPTTDRFYSEIDHSGLKISNKTHTVSLSRLIYALAWTSQFDSANLALAKQAANFQLTHMLGEDVHGPYFMQVFDGKLAHTSDTLDIWRQAYGLNGLTELYRQTNDQTLLAKIHTLHHALLKRFHDDQHGGFVNEYSLTTGQIKSSKSIQSLIYPISAYMANLWLADTKNRAKYQPFLAEHLNIALTKPIWNQNTGWINVTFDQKWQVCGNEQQTSNKLCFSVSPGHNFQFAWFLLRAHADWRFIPQSQSQQAKLLADTIMAKTLTQPIWHNEIEQGFYSGVNPNTNQILDKRKTWWQHAEALIALSYVQKDYPQHYLQLTDFFFKHFPDYTNGNEVFYLNEDNKPDISQLKGSEGKSAYHLTEAVRFLIEANN